MRSKNQIHGGVNLMYASFESAWYRFPGCAIAEIETLYHYTQDVTTQVILAVIMLGTSTKEG